MVLLSTFGSELEAQMMASRLKEAGIDHKIEKKEGESDFDLFVFDDDLEEAQEILEARSFEDDDFADDFADDLDGMDDIDDFDDFDDD